MQQNLLLESCQLRRRLDPEFFSYLAAESLEGAQRLRLPARAVQRHHQLVNRALAERMTATHTLQLPDQLAGFAFSELSIEAVLDCRQFQLLEPPYLRLREFLVGELFEGRSTP